MNISYKACRADISQASGVSPCMMNQNIRFLHHNRNYVRKNGSFERSERSVSDCIVSEIKGFEICIYLKIK